MLRTGPGPRDWSAPEIPQYRAPVAVRRSVSSSYCPTPYRVLRRRSRTWAFLSLLLSLIALVFCLAPHVIGNGGWAASTVGISAVALGVAAYKQKWMLGSLGRMAAMLGIALGVAATALMLVFIVTAWVGTTPATQAMPPAASVPAAAEPAPVAAPPDAENGMDVAQAAATLVFLLERGWERFGNYPSVLEPSVTNLVLTPAGSVQLPPGATFVYRLWSDGRGFDLTVTSASGKAAVYDSTSGGVVIR